MCDLGNHDSWPQSDDLSGKLFLPNKKKQSLQILQGLNLPSDEAPGSYPCVSEAGPSPQETEAQGFPSSGETRVLFLFTQNKSFDCNLEEQRIKGTPGTVLALDLIK